MNSLENELDATASKVPNGFSSPYLREEGTRLMVSNRGGVSFTMRGPRIILFSFIRMSSFSTEPSAASPPPHWRTGKV